jgi:hypothetical protein
MIGTRSELTSAWDTRGKVSLPYCIHNRSKSICVNSAWKLPLAVTSRSSSTPRIAAWYGMGSVKRKRRIWAFLGRTRSASISKACASVSALCRKSEVRAGDPLLVCIFWLSRMRRGFGLWYNPTQRLRCKNEPGVCSASDARLGAASPQRGQSTTVVRSQISTVGNPA